MIMRVSGDMTDTAKGSLQDCLLSWEARGPSTQPKLVQHLQCTILYLMQHSLHLCEVLSHLQVALLLLLLPQHQLLL